MNITELLFKKKKSSKVMLTSRTILKLLELVYIYKGKFYVESTKNV